MPTAKTSRKLSRDGRNNLTSKKEGYCLLCKKNTKLDHSEITVRDQCAMFESFCALLNITIPEENRWNFFEDVLPFCKSCKPMLSDMSDLYTDLQVIQGKLFGVLARIRKTYCADDKAALPLSRTEDTVSNKIEYLQKQLTYTFLENRHDDQTSVVSSDPLHVKTDQCSSSATPSPLKHVWEGDNTSTATISSPSFSSDSTNKLNKSDKDQFAFSISRSISSASFRNQEKHGDNVTTARLSSQLIRDNQSDRNPIIESGAMTARENNTPVTTPSLKNMETDDVEIVQEHPDELSEARESKLLASSCSKSPESAKSVGKNGNDSFGSFSDEVTDFCRTKQYSRDESDDWQEKLVTYPKPDWTTVFHKHGFTYAGINVKSVGNGFECGMCGMRWRKHALVLDHLEYVHLGFHHWYPCLLCRRISRSSDFKYHYQKYHPNDSVPDYNLTCRSCGKQFCDYNLFVRHSKVHERGQKQRTSLVAKKETKPERGKRTRQQKDKSAFLKETNPVSYTLRERQDGETNQLFELVEEDSGERRIVLSLSKSSASWKSVDGDGVLESSDDATVGKNAVFYCGMCGFQFCMGSPVCNKALGQHIAQHRENSTFCCLLCAASFSSLESAFHHQKAHLEYVAGLNQQTKYLFFEPDLL